MTDGEELSARVGSILFDINNQITHLTEVIQDVELSIQDLGSLQTHNAGVLGAINILTGVIEDIRYTIASKYRVIVQTLEEYSNHS
jgi:hypothetical protein